MNNDKVDKEQHFFGSQNELKERYETLLNGIRSMVRLKRIIFTLVILSSFALLFYLLLEKVEIYKFFIIIAIFMIFSCAALYIVMLNRWIWKMAIEIKTLLLDDRLDKIKLPTSAGMERKYYHKRIKQNLILLSLSILYNMSFILYSYVELSPKMTEFFIMWLIVSNDFLILWIVIDYID